MQVAATSRMVGKQEVIRAANWLAIVSVGENIPLSLIDWVVSGYRLLASAIVLRKNPCAALQTTEMVGS
jgi:hypothetical protein